MVEQLTLNQRVLGSSPWWRTIPFYKGLWPVGQVVKTAASHAVNMGSNPVRVTIFPLAGVDCDEVPPVPIPNTVVKLICADDTWREAAW